MNFPFNYCYNQENPGKLFGFNFYCWGNVRKFFLELFMKIYRKLTRIDKNWWNVMMMVDENWRKSLEIKENSQKLMKIDGNRQKITNILKKHHWLSWFDFYWKWVFPHLLKNRLRSKSHKYKVLLYLSNSTQSYLINFSRYIFYHIICTKSESQQKSARKKEAKFYILLLHTFQKMIHKTWKFFANSRGFGEFFKLLQA